jgi:hypothetical protein
MGAEAVISSSMNRKTPCKYAAFLYKVGNMHHFRGIATRYNKTAISFLGFVQLVAIFYG